MLAVRCLGTGIQASIPCYTGEVDEEDVNTASACSSYAVIAAAAAAATKALMIWI